MPSALTAPTPSAAPVLDVATQQAHRLSLGNHVGGKTTSPPWDEATMQGYVVNRPSGSTVSGLLTSWGYGAMVGNGLSGEEFSAGTQPYPVQSSAQGATYYDGEVLDPAFNASTVYPWQFRVIAPEVEAAARDNLTATVAATYRVDVPEDLLTYTAT